MGRAHDPVGASPSSTLLWANWANWYVWIVLFVTLSYGAIGFYDDYLKISRTHTAGRLGQAAPAGGGRRRRVSLPGPSYRSEVRASRHP